MTEQTVTLRDFRVAEYEQLKAEQRTRIGIRDNLVYGTLTALGASAVFASTTSRGGLALLVVPLVCVALGWTYLRNNAKISAIGRYLAGVFPDSWETHRVSEPGRRRRKVVQLLVDVIVFVVTGAAALVLFVASGQGTALTLLFAAGDCLLLLLLAVEFVSNSDILFTKIDQNQLAGGHGGTSDWN